MSKKINQHELIQALLTSRTIKDACKVANVTETTMHKYLKDYDFKEALESAREDLFKNTNSLLSATLCKDLSNSLSKLSNIIQNEETSAIAVIKAIQLQFEIFERLKGREIDRLERNNPLSML